ncbi:MAG: hypothetical protein QG633_335 [Patescibacteria group bacterium]|jgi:hypothetical protein|nr:hypothetical protein [Patescibacteria group bacterium]
MKFESAPEEKEPTKEIPKQETTVEDIEKEVVGVDSEKNRAERLVILRQKQIELKKVMEILDESFLREDKGEEHEKKKVNGAETSFYIKTKLLPEMIAWTLKREKEGKDIDFLEYVQEEDLSDLDLDIIIKEIDRYNNRKEAVPMKQEAMLAKAALCNDLRSDAHMILAEIGNIDPVMKEIKLGQLKEDFDEWFDRFFERLEVKIELWQEGVPFLNVIFEKFWDGQGTIDKMFAKLSKKRMGLIKHTFMLRGLARRIEMVVDFADKSDNAEEVRHYAAEAKGYTKLMVEWNNEYRRLHRSSTNSNIDGAYDGIVEGANKLDELAIMEIYPDQEGGRGYRKSPELPLGLDKRKKEICGSLLVQIREHYDKRSGIETRFGLNVGEDEKRRIRRMLENEATDFSKLVTEISDENKIDSLSEEINLLKYSAHQKRLILREISELDQLILDAKSGSVVKTAQEKPGIEEPEAQAA